MPRRGSRRKKKRTEKDVDISEREKQTTPRCFVLKQGNVGDRVKNLVKDFRDVMMPNCAKSVRESRKNRLEDFIAVAGHLRISHIVFFSVTKKATYMKVTRLPQGPTLTFKVDNFSLARDVRASQRRPRIAGAQAYGCAPLQVLNGFSGGGSKKQDKSGKRQLLAEMLRNLFPAVDVPTFNQAECRRTALFHYDQETEHLHFRHFIVVRRPVGMRPPVAKLCRLSRIPKLGKSADIADFVLGGGGGASESEMDEGMEAPAQNGGKVAVKLAEIGPRLTLLLIKAEEGVCGGSVIYHRYQTKTPSQREVLEQKARQKRKLKLRNAKLAEKANTTKAKRREKNKMKKDTGEDGSERNESMSESDSNAAKGGGRGSAKGSGAEGKNKTELAGGSNGKKRHHPFSWHSKSKKVAKRKE